MSVIRDEEEERGEGREGRGREDVWPMSELSGREEDALSLSQSLINNAQAKRKTRVRRGNSLMYTRSLSTNLAT